MLSYQKTAYGRWAAVALMLIVGLGAGGAMFGSVQAQSNSRLFPETGKTVKGRLLDYWNRNGGLAQQGYPISEEMQERSDTDGKTYTVQYFERAVFELHPENQAPHVALSVNYMKFRDYGRRVTKVQDIEAELGSWTT